MNSEAAELQQAIRFARWSAVLGTVGLLTAVFGFGVVLALAAIAFAAIALNQLSPAHSHIQGVAVVGLLAGILALLVFPLLLATAVPRFIADRRTAAHEQCYSNLLAIDSAKEKWAQQRGAPGDVRPPADELFGPGRIMARTPRCPSGGRYIIGAVEKSARCTIAEHNEPVGALGPPRQLQFSMGDFPKPFVP